MTVGTESKCSLKLTALRPTGCKKLKDSAFYRIHVGMYRIIYSIQDNALLVVIIRIAHRKEVYR